MSTVMEDDIKRWTAKRKTALVLDIIQGKTTVSEASRTYDLNPSEVEPASVKVVVALSFKFLKRLDAPCLVG